MHLAGKLSEKVCVYILYEAGVKFCLEHGTKIEVFCISSEQAQTRAQRILRLAVKLHIQCGDFALQFPKINYEYSARTVNLFPSFCFRESLEKTESLAFFLSWLTKRIFFSAHFHFFVLLSSGIFLFIKHDSCNDPKQATVQ